MIENPLPSDWKMLQFGVARILNEVGITATVEKKIATPRGEVEIDVYGVDENSVENIRYIVECKNWMTPITQSVVHAFTTVMHECGGHIGMIIATNGLQEGAKRYLQSTNIVGLTYAEFQQRYFHLWTKKYFYPRISQAADALIQYVEPLNFHRGRFVEKLTETSKEKFHSLQARYEIYGIVLGTMNVVETRYFSRHRATSLPDISEYKIQFEREFGPEFRYNADYYRELADEICEHIKRITSEFDEIFGKNIFDCVEKNYV